MNLKQEICAAFSDGIIVKEVPVGYSVSTQVEWFFGETISFYVRVEGERMRLEDSGHLLFDLEGQGVDFSSENCKKVLQVLLNDHNVLFGEDNGTFCTKWVAKDKIAELTIPFLTFLTRIQDLLFLNREIVKSTFKDDLEAA